MVCPYCHSAPLHLSSRFIILQCEANSTLRTDKAQSKGQLYLEKLDFFTTSDVNAIHHVLVSQI